MSQICIKNKLSFYVTSYVCEKVVTNLLKNKPMKTMKSVRTMESLRTMRSMRTMKSNDSMPS